MKQLVSSRLGLEDSIADLLNHPVLRPFARHLLPMAQAPCPDLKLRDIAELMPWHNHVHPVEALQAINHVIAEENAGRPVFHSFYKALSLRDHTGLFFFRGKPDAPFALICSGGGFRYVGTLHEGLPFAHYLSRCGINAFSLQYRPEGEKAACKDLAQALSWIFQNAAALEISPAGYSVWGASAGGRMAANLGSYGNENLGGANLPQPAAIVLAYTNRDWIGNYEPPTFAIASRNDHIAPVQVMLERTRALRANGVAAELMVVNGARHGFGLGTGTDAEGWIDFALDFWLHQV